MKIDRVEYFWGLFEEPDLAAASGANTHVVLEASDVPDQVRQSFADERMEELSGQFGLPGAGQPEQVDVLKVTAGRRVWEIRVLNLAITLFAQNNEQISRLHRFFSVLSDAARKISDRDARRC
jgi:hypothetical protein